MGFQKISNFGKLIIILAILPTCKKQTVRNYFVRAKICIPYSNVPIQGLEYTITSVEYTDGFFLNQGATKTSDWRLKGIAGSDGIIETKFSRKHYEDVHYSATVDYSKLVIPYDSYMLIGDNPSIYVEPGYNVLNVSVLPLMNIVYNFKNLNCTGSTDTFRYKVRNIDEDNAFYSSYWNFPWTEGSEYNGCVNSIGTAGTLRPAGRYVFHWEAERSGVFDSGIDTFLVSPETSNTINMFW
jgi:hypothetical protein